MSDYHDKRKYYPPKKSQKFEQCESPLTLYCRIFPTLFLFEILSMSSKID
jgi:hypothetical protein